MATNGRRWRESLTMAKLNLTLLIGNPLMKLLLRSPWHWNASGELMLITVTGRKTGKRYTTPVNYVQDANLLSVLTHAHRTWWRNLRGGAPVEVVLRGRREKGVGFAYEGAAAVERFYRHLQLEPKFAPLFDVAVDEAGQPLRASAESAAAGKVMVEVQLPAEDWEIEEDEAEE